MNTIVLQGTAVVHLCGAYLDTTNGCIKLRGKKRHVENMQRSVKVILHQHEKDETDKSSSEHIKSTQGCQAYLRYLGAEETVRFPSYWKCVRKGTADKKKSMKRNLIDPQSPVYEDIESLLLRTWKPHEVGHGKDAVGLHHSRIDVKKIWSVENPVLYRKYDARKKEICLQAAGHRCPSVKDLLGESDILTHRQGLKVLNGNLVDEINECYLFHGTKSELTDAIENKGFDFRIGGDSAMFGKGVYFAESSTKADQYADEKSKRVGPGKSLKMFVARVLLGRTFICRQRRQLRKPPCTSCYEDSCVISSHRSCFDSVVATHKDATTRLKFREFIVYDLSQSYPEFLVKYERK